jgi:hypothetical protein
VSALDDARAALAQANADLIAAVKRDDGSAQDAMTLVHYAAVEVQRADAAQRQATNDAVVVEWSPPNAPHVSGSWSPRAFDSYGLPIPQRVECRCSTCGQTWGTLCGSGLVRAHVQRFALAHLHFEPIGARLPGSGEA